MLRGKYKKISLAWFPFFFLYFGFFSPLFSAGKVLWMIIMRVCDKKILFSIVKLIPRTLNFLIITFCLVFLHTYFKSWLLHTKLTSCRKNDYNKRCYYQSTGSLKIMGIYCFSSVHPFIFLKQIFYAYLGKQGSYCYAPVCQSVSRPSDVSHYLRIPLRESYLTWYCGCP